METPITPEQFRVLLPFICDRETTQDEARWTPDNPLHGHCAVVSLVAQNLFGGELLRGSLLEVPGFEYMRSHYWNRLADGMVVDFTKPQFGDRYPEGLASEVKMREYVLFDPQTGAPREIMKLQRLVGLGNTVLIIEHNLDVIKCADYIIDLGPEGGVCGGRILAKGTPEEVAAEKNSYTGGYLKKVL